METFGKRLLALIAEYGKGKLKFAEKIGVSSSKLSSYIKEENPSLPSSDVIARIDVEFPQFNISWLLSGKGEMYNAGFAPPKKSEPSEILETIEELRALVAGFNKRIEMLESYVFRKADQLMPAGKSRANSDRKVSVLSALPNR